MSRTRNKIISQAQSWIGCKESDGSHRKIIDVYNSHKPLARGYKVKYTDAWCATFVSACAVAVGYTDIIPTECGAEEMVKLFQKMGKWVENDNYKPSAGDVIFYDWDDTGVGDCTGHSDHVGIVEKVSGSNITVIEGNKSNAVGRRTLQVGGRYIRGYGVPAYDVETSTKKSLDEIAKEVLQGKWGNGSDRVTALQNAGYNPQQVQERVNSMLSGKTSVDLTKVAKQVILGLYGNGEARRQKLKKEGYDPDAVQKKVNELLS